MVRKERNSSLADAMRAAGIDGEIKQKQPAAKKVEKSTSKEGRSWHAGVKKLKSKQQIHHGPKGRKRSKPRKRKKPAGKLRPPIITHSNIRAAYGGSRKSAGVVLDELSGADDMLKLADGIEGISVGEYFRPSVEGVRYPNLLHVPRCWARVSNETRLTNAKTMQLGLDMGTSSTKVVIRDAALRRANTWAVPFFEQGDDRYLLPTSIEWNDDLPRISTSSSSMKPFKWSLIVDGLKKNVFIDASAYLALVLRHVVAWLHHEEGGYYKPENMVWELRIGLPAETLEDEQLVNAYRWVLAIAIKLASMVGEITLTKVEQEVEDSINQYRQGDSPGVDDHFETSGMLLPTEPTPEIAAAIAGFRNSDQWNPRRPYGLLLDVGASTVDTAFCSITGSDQATFNDFTRSVERLGVLALHDQRIEWLLKMLERIGSEDDQLHDKLLKGLCLLGFDRPIPDNINDYLLGVDVVTNEADVVFLSKLAEVVVTKNLIAGMNRYTGGASHRNPVIPVYTSGGGIRHAIYERLLSNVANSKSITWSIEVKRLKLPQHVHAPGLREDDRDRLIVAYGLCADEEWKVNWPDTIGDFRIEKHNNSINFVSKDQV